MSKTEDNSTRVILTKTLRLSLRDPVEWSWENAFIKLDLLIQPSSDFVLAEKYASKFSMLLNELAEDQALKNTSTFGQK